MKKNLKAALTAVFVLLTLHCGYSKNDNTVEEKSKTFNGVEVVYESSAITEAEVDKLGEYFIASGYANGDEKAALLTKSDELYQFYLVVNNDLMQDQESIDLLKTFGEELCTEVFEDKAVDYYLCNGDLQPLVLFPAFEDPTEKPKFVIVNETGYDVHYLFASQYDSEDWEDDVLGDNLLESEQLFIVRLFDPLSAANRYDIRLVDEKGATYTKEDILITNNRYIYFSPEDLDAK